MKMWIKTRNLSHSKLLLVEEQQFITTGATVPGTLSSGNPSPGVANQVIATQVLTKVRIRSNTAFSPIRSRIEGWGLSRFRKNTLNVLLID